MRHVLADLITACAVAVISVHILCLDDCFTTTIITQPTEITQFIFGQPLSPPRVPGLHRPDCLASFAITL